MSKESWLFLFAALGGVGGVAQILQIWNQMRTPPKTEHKGSAMPASRSVVITTGGLLLLSLLVVFSIGLSVFGFYNSMVRVRDAEPVTEANIEKKVDQWIDAFHLGRRKLPDEEGAYFAVEVTLLNDARLRIVRPKDLGHYLLVARTIAIAPDHKNALDRLSNERRSRILLSLTSELARLKMLYSIQFPTGISVFKRVPITTALSESQIIQTIDEVETGSNLARDLFVLGLSDAQGR